MYQHLRMCAGMMVGVSEGHDHLSAVSAGGRHKRPLFVAFGITASYMLVEGGVGIATGSLALISDAGHMLTDVAGLGMALAAIQFAESRKKPAQTYGLYRLEVLASLANAFLLFGVAGYVLYEAISRFSDPPDVPGAPVLIVALIGLSLNLVSYRLLQAGSKESLNVRGAFLEVVADALGSAGVVLAGLIVLLTGWPYADPIIGSAIGLFILPRTWRLGRHALRILLEVAPEGIDVEEVERRLADVSGVQSIHDLHVWTLTSGLEAASGHLLMTPDGDLAAVLHASTRLLQDDFAINHVTLQCEPAGFREQRPEV